MRNHLNGGHRHPPFYRRLSLWVALFFLILPTSVRAQPEDRPDPEREPAAEAAIIPGTRAGNQLMWVLKVVNGQDLGDLSDHFTDRFVTTKGDETRELLQGLRQEVFQGGKVVINKILDSREEDISAEITAKDSWRYLHVFVMIDEKTGKIAALRFAPAGGVGRNVGNWKQFEGALGRMPAGVSFGAYELVARDPEDPASPLFMRVVSEIEADRRLNIGPTAYLYTLGALAEEVAKGTTTWETKVTLKDDWKSLPPGDLRDQQGEFTLAELARHVMDESDNTAADHLLHTVGRDKVEAYMATLNLAHERSQPFLTSREEFALKLSNDKDLLARYAIAEPPARLAMLPDLQKRTPDPVALEAWNDPIEVERIGWFASASECCRVMFDLHRLTQKDGMEPLEKALRANRGLKISKDTWPRAWYKGGSEPGVLNMTWFMERDDGRLFVMSVGWNNTKTVLQEARLLDMAVAGFRLLAEEGRPKAPAPPAPKPKADPDAAN